MAPIFPATKKYANLYRHQTNMAPIYPATKKNTPIQPPSDIFVDILALKRTPYVNVTKKQDVSGIKCFNTQDAPEVLSIYATFFQIMIQQVLLVWTNGVEFHQISFQDEIGNWSELEFSPNKMF